MQIASPGGSLILAPPVVRTINLTFSLSVYFVGAVTGLHFHKYLSKESLLGGLTSY